MSFSSRFFLILCLVLQLGFFWGSQFTLYSNLEETEANNIILVLSKQGILAEKVQLKDKFVVNVDQEISAQAIKILHNHGLPHREFDTLGKLFANNGIISSPNQENIRYLHALSQEIEETLANIDGVMVTRVNIVTAKENSLGQEISPASASVFIKYHPDYNMIDNVLKIKQLVASSVPKLDYSKVSVSLFEAVDLDIVSSQSLEVDNQQEHTSTYLSIIWLILLVCIVVIIIYFRSNLLGYIGLWMNKKQDPPLVDASNVNVDNSSQSPGSTSKSNDS